MTSLKRGNTEQGLTSLKRGNAEQGVTSLKRGNTEQRGRLHIYFMTSQIEAERASEETGSSHHKRSIKEQGCGSDFIDVPHADDNRIGPCRVQQQRGSRAQQEQQEIQGATEKKGPGRPRKMMNVGAGTHVAPGASKPDMGERPRRKAAIRAEENVRRWTSKDPEAWPLLQARADQRRLLQRN